MFILDCTIVPLTLFSIWAPNKLCPWARMIQAIFISQQPLQGQCINLSYVFLKQYQQPLNKVAFVWFDSLRPINNLSVIKGRVFLGWTSTKLGLMFLLKDTTQWRRWGSNPRPFGLESSTLPLSHYTPKQSSCFVSAVILLGKLFTFLWKKLI